jgi:Flp pilus assembly protein TadB
LSAAYNRLVRGPPITIKCDCGELRHVPYGDRWQCEQCGRTWNTAQIPAEEYWGILRGMRRHRLVVIGVAVAVALVFTLLAIFVAESLFLLMPAVLAGWFIWYMPFWRRKVRREARNLPKWNLHPD